MSARDPIAAPARSGGAAAGGESATIDTAEPAILTPDLTPPTKRRLLTRKRAYALLGAALLCFAALITWLAIVAPPSQVPRPLPTSTLVLLAEDGQPIARIGQLKEQPVDVTRLPRHVADAFVAIEDRRFWSHLGVDPRSIARAVWVRAQSGRWEQGGSTITQQLAKNAFLSSERTFLRKGQEALIAVWLEAWLTKEEILSRYLSTVYFGDGVYGLRAATQLYFGKAPERLSVAEAAMLAGLVVAPSSLAPSRNLRGAQRRAALVIATMVQTGALSEQQAGRIAPARVIRQPRRLASGSYFADWVRDEARSRAGAGYGELFVETTLNRRLQATAERAVARERLPGTEIALVAMRPDGRVVAMVGGRDYATSAFNRATQARRQAGSTFKLFVYAAAVRRGYDAESDLSGARLTIGTWSPRNMDGRYPDEISLRDAFTTSNNTAAVRLSEEVGRARVMQAARDFGITSDLPQGPSLALGSGEVSLLELTSAYASVAAGAYPVRPRGLERTSWDRPGQRPIPAAQLEELRGLLQSVVSQGSGRSAGLPIAAFGKTGTSQNNRDAWFVGFAGNLVVGVWIGRDNEQPMEGMTGSGIPARVWRRFMQEGLRLRASEAR